MNKPSSNASRAVGETQRHRQRQSMEPDHLGERSIVGDSDIRSLLNLPEEEAIRFLQRLRAQTRSLITASNAAQRAAERPIIRPMLSPPYAMLPPGPPQAQSMARPHSRFNQYLTARDRGRSLLQRYAGTPMQMAAHADRSIVAGPEAASGVNVTYRRLPVSALVESESTSSNDTGGSSTTGASTSRATTSRNLTGSSWGRERTLPTADGHTRAQRRQLALTDDVTEGTQTRVHNRIDQASADWWELKYVDDKTFRNILHSYFCWEHSCSQVFDEDIFTEDLLVGPSDFCNAYLIHALLAMGSMTYRTEDATCADFVRHLAFIKARKAREVLGGRDTPASIAGDIVLQVVHASLAVDQNGFTYLADAARAGRGYGFFDPSRAAFTHPNERVNRGRAVCAWGLLEFVSMTSAYTYTAPLLEGTPPSAVEPVMRRAGLPGDWAPWPSNEPLRPDLGHLTWVARQILVTTLRDATILSLEQKTVSEAVYLDRAMQLHNRLRLWRNSWDPSLQTIAQAPPCVLAIHSLYHSVVSILFSPICPAGSEEDDNRQIALTIRADSIQQTRRLIQEWLALYDRPLPIFFTLLQWQMCFDAISGADVRSEDAEARLFFSLGVRQLRRSADLYPLFHYLISALRRTTLREGIMLAPEVQEIFEEAAQQEADASTAVTAKDDMKD